jgi:hypothetical protein
MYFLRIKTASWFENFVTVLVTFAAKKQKTAGALRSGFKLV